MGQTDAQGSDHNPWAHPQRRSVGAEQVLEATAAKVSPPCEEEPGSEAGKHVPREESPGPAGTHTAAQKPHAALPPWGGPAALTPAEPARRPSGLLAGAAGPPQAASERPQRRAASPGWPPAPRPASRTHRPAGRRSSEGPGSPRASRRTQAPPGLRGVTAPPRGPGDASQKWQRGV